MLNDVEAVGLVSPIVLMKRGVGLLEEVVEYEM